jgi:ectoine hydroxylase-related dioxygenase (phytanoyl-CoA dioxygenase family)
MILRITPPSAERRSGALSSETIEQASRSFRVEGALILEDVVDVSLIARAKKAFNETYARYLVDSELDDALTVGKRRLMITVDLEPPFDAPQLFANPWLLPILSAALDEDFVLGAFGVVCSLPSAPGQHQHRDGGILFPHSGIDPMLPVAAITVAIPLLEMNASHGTTALWLGSHRDESRASNEASIEPVVSEGSCVIWDYRLLHAGTPNRSTVPRPLLYLVYCRSWFVDQANFKKQTPLRASKSTLSGLSESHQRLLARAQVC